MPKHRLKIALIALGLLSPLSYALAGTISSTEKFAWSGNVGYVNFEGVTVTDSALTGYAWSANKGFINFSPVLGGVVNDGTGNLSGSAWGAGLGWIDFNGVHIDANGRFSGTATGALVGTITFDCPGFCDVRTDWRQAVAAPPSSNRGGGSGTSHPLSQTSLKVSFLPVPVPLPATTSSPVLRTIGILDMNAMMVDWGIATCGLGGDLDEDCIVGILDFNMAMVDWGSGQAV